MCPRETRRYRRPPLRGCRILPALAGPFLTRCGLIARCRGPRGSRNSEAPNLSLGRSVLRYLAGPLSGVLLAATGPSRASVPPGGMTSLPGASFNARFLPGTLSAIYPPLGIPANVQWRQFRAHTRNIVIKESYDLRVPSPSAIRAISSQMVGLLLFLVLWRRRKIHEEGVRATNCLNLDAW